MDEFRLNLAGLESALIAGLSLLFIAIAYETTVRRHYNRRTSFLDCLRLITTEKLVADDARRLPTGELLTSLVNSDARVFYARNWKGNEDDETIIIVLRDCTFALAMFYHDRGVIACGYGRKDSDFRNNSAIEPVNPTESDRFNAGRILESVRQSFERNPIIPLPAD